MGGKGVKVMHGCEDLIPNFESVSSKALVSFGDVSVLIECCVERPHHIEVQILGDGKGNAIHLWEKDFFDSEEASEDDRDGTSVAFVR